MRNFKSDFIYALKYLWQLPLNIIGLIYGYFYISEWIYSKLNFDLYIHTNKGCVTLGRYIFISSRATTLTVIHETGHVKLSEILGPLYLLVIGLPSLLWAAMHKYIAPKKSYYWFYTEKWANKLAGLDI